MSNAFIQLRHFAATVENGLTERCECPWCGGGESKEAAFAITRVSEAEAKYICHRASCGKHGRIAVWGFKLRQFEDNSAVKGKQFTPRLYSDDTRELSAEWVSELLDLYGITQSEALGANWRTELVSGNLVCPVLSHSGVVRGYEVRRSKVQVPYVSSPKTESYRLLECPWLGWYRETHSSGTVVLVEDAISALKVSRHFQVACLHGSHITLEMLLEVLEIAGVSDNIMLALDADATGKALKFAAEWRFLAPNFRCVPLSNKDLKYESDEEIQRIIKNA